MSICRSNHCFASQKRLPICRAYRVAFSALLAASVALLTGIKSAHAQYLVPTAITTTIPTGSNNGTRNGASAANAYVDDVYLNTISFGSGNNAISFSATGGAAYGSRGQFGTVKRALVVFNPGNINAEFGDQDTNSDGDSNPFVKAGVATENEVLTGDPNAKRESTDPTIQYPAITAAFNGLDLVEGIDGESNAANPNFAFDLVFNQGIASDGNTATPEMLFFERGRNSQYNVQVITGLSSSGDFTFAGTSVNVDSGNLSQASATGIYINTIEIDNGQQLGATGLSLDSFGLSSGQVIYGVRITSLNDSGADMYGTFLSAASASQFRPGLDSASMPEPGTLSLLSMGFLTGASMMGLVHRRKAARQTVRQTV